VAAGAFCLHAAHAGLDLGRETEHRAGHAAGDGLAAHPDVRLEVLRRA
jgi:hypothetical protein